MSCVDAVVVSRFRAGCREVSVVEPHVGRRACLGLSLVGGWGRQGGNATGSARGVAWRGCRQTRAAARRRRRLAAMAVA